MSINDYYCIVLTDCQVIVYWSIFSFCRSSLIRTSRTIEMDPNTSSPSAGSTRNKTSTTSETSFFHNFIWPTFLPASDLKEYSTQMYVGFLRAKTQGNTKPDLASFTVFFNIQLVQCEEVKWRTRLLGLKNQHTCETTVHLFNVFSYYVNSDY